MWILIKARKSIIMNLWPLQCAGINELVPILTMSNTHRRITIDEERLMLAFETLDIDNTGYLDAKSIRRALGNQMTEDEIKEMVQSHRTCVPPRV